MFGRHLNIHQLSIGWQPAEMGGVEKWRADLQIAWKHHGKECDQSLTEVRK